MEENGENVDVNLGAENVDSEIVDAENVDNANKNVKFLAKHNLAFRGSNERLYQNSNENFLGLIEMLAEFDPIVQEHVRCITDDNVHVHFLGHEIQNELILLLAFAIKNEIITKVKQAKYFSMILDYTPDVSYQEQISLIIRYVDVSSNFVSVEEFFLGFLNVNDTTGQGLLDVLQDDLKKLDIDILYVWGQCYDNGSNMKGKHQGVQNKFLDNATLDNATLEFCCRRFEETLKHNEQCDIDGK
ncbi:uncharacterized protein LOC131657847 [Vicia villosa]|uniref:uncharacterized protein LOC131657847 n=1 Tax=Vicia villosa TaxID=3911 RepID=UPI00273B5404|nr:uncharacterized protein LOC131657847 [Vicia villosa]